MADLHLESRWRYDVVAEHAVIVVASQAFGDLKVRGMGPVICPTHIVTIRRLEHQMVEPL